MPMARLKKLGGSVAVTIPSAILKATRFEKDMDVLIEVQDGAIVIRRANARRTLHQILAECDLAAEASSALGRFDADPAVGDALI